MTLKPPSGSNAATVWQTFEDRLGQLAVNVKAAPYNAAGDGTTDDTTGIQAAIDAVEAAGGGLVFFPAGTYQISSSLTVAANGVQLRGAGRKNTKIRPTTTWTATNPLIDANNGTTGVAGFEIDELRVDGAASSGTWKPNVCVQVQWVTGGETEWTNLIRRCHISGYKQTGLLLGTNGFEVAAHVIENFIGDSATTQDDTTRKGIWVKPGAGSIIIANNRINNNRQAGIYGESGGLQIIGNHIFGHGSAWTAAEYPTCIKLVRGGGHVIVGNYLDTCKQNEMVVIAPDTAGQSMNDITITGNYVIQAVAMRNATDTANAQYALVHIDATTASVSCVTIANNVGTANATTTFSNIVRFTASPSVVKLVDNTIRNCDGFASNMGLVRAFHGNSVSSAAGAFTHGGLIDGSVRTLTDGANVNVDAAAGSYHYLNVAANANRTINFPSNLQAGMVVEFEIRNGSGGVYGSVFTWAASYKLAGAWTMPANGASRTIRFRARDTGQLVEVARSPADITTTA